jgi:RimJ/RimL family protein N-acetyltransferase
LKIPKNVELENITSEELEQFWGQLTTEKKYLNNPFQSNLIFVAGVRQNDEIVGVGGLKRHFGIFPFEFVVVNKAFQGRGLGSRIISEISDFARRRSYSVIFASANKKNTASTKIFRKSGFKTLSSSSPFSRFGVALNSFGEILIAIMPAIFFVYSLYRRYREK